MLKNNFLKIETENLLDSNLFKIMIFLKRSTSGIITKNEFEYLESLRISFYPITNPIDFFEIIKKLYQFYYSEFFKRRSN